MKTKKKDFDCVEMKGRIQAQLEERLRGLSIDERERRMEEMILSDPILATAWAASRPIRPSGLVHKPK